MRRARGILSRRVLCVVRRWRGVLQNGWEYLWRTRSMRRTSVLERLRRRSQGRYDGPVQATTRRVGASDLVIHTMAATPR